MQGPVAARGGRQGESPSVLRTLSSKKPLEHGSLTPEKPKKRKQMPHSWKNGAWLEVPVYATRTAWRRGFCLALPSQNMRPGAILHRNYACTLQNSLAVTSDCRRAEWLLLSAHHSARALQPSQRGSQLGSQAVDTRDVPASATARDGLHVCGADSDTILAMS